MNALTFRLRMVAVVAVLATAFTMSVPVLAATVPVFRLAGVTSETQSDLAHLLGDTKARTLYQLVSRMDRAAADPDVPAVVVLIESPVLGFAQLQEVRAAMQRVRDAGKQVHLFAEDLTIGSYLLSTGASEISVVPSGALALIGIGSESVYLRGLLDKIGVEPDIVHIGEFKDAGETLMRTGPSDSSLKQMNRMLDDLYAQMLDAVVESRDMDRDKAENALTSGPYTSERALEIGLIDAVRYRKEFLDRIRARYEAEFETDYGAPKVPKLDFSTPFGIFQLFSEMMQEVKPARLGASIAVVNVEGMIAQGKNTDSGAFGKICGSRTLRKALEKAAQDDNIKAVVLRVDSPGGSALASEIIWKGTHRIQQVKPLIVSMGNVAASGGYYVACGADHIFADAGTITGSIGVLGGKMVTTGMWDKLGISWHQETRGNHAKLYSTATPFSDEEREIIRQYMGEVYATFKQRVADGRGNRLKGELDSLAGGRVYTGREALEIGLVDEIGGLQDALTHAAEVAGLEDYRVRILPAPKSIVDLLREAMGLEDDSEKLLSPSSVLAAGSLLRAAAPLLSDISPARRAAIMRVLTSAEVLRRESVVLVPPFELAPR